MNLKLRDKIRKEIGKLRNERFENFVNDILRIEYIRFGTLETMVNKQGNQRKSKPDAHILWENEGKEKYFIFNHTIEGKPKIIKDINDTINGKVPHERIYKYVTCTNQPIGEERAEFSSLLKEFGIEYDVISLDKLTDLSIKHKQILSAHLNIEYQEESSYKFFDCGHRIRVLREERELSKSQFIELVDIRSEKELENIENNNLECSTDLINQVSKLTGAEEEWIKHGTKKKYTKVDLYNIINGNVFDLIKRNKYADKVVICVEPEHIRFAYLFKFSDTEIGIYAKYTAYDFWNWAFMESNPVIDLFSQIKKIYNHFSTKVEGRIISKEDSDHIHSYNCYPKAIIDELRNDGNFMIEALFEDFDIEESYYRKFKWFVEFHKFYQKYKSYIKES